MPTPAIKAHAARLVFIDLDPFSGTHGYPVAMIDLNGADLEPVLDYSPFRCAAVLDADGELLGYARWTAGEMVLYTGRAPDTGKLDADGYRSAVKAYAERQDLIAATRDRFAR